MNILLLSAYDAESHKYWHEGLVAAFPEYHFTRLILPARYFSWRVRGSSLQMSRWLKDALDGFKPGFDLVVATSMIDLAVLKGLEPRIATIPSLLYFHENQFEFPTTAHVKRSIEPQLVSIYSALAADKLCFNSAFNQRSFLDGATALLKKFPDFVPAGIVDELERKASVLPVALADDVFSKPSALGRERTRSVVWNHRWEYDKAPDRLLRVLECLPPSEAFEFHIVGQQFKNVPDAFPKVRALLEARGWLRRWGRIERRADYVALLEHANVVLSTAIHDFQGVSVLEAMACGCTPVVPDRLAYKEYVDDAYRYFSAGTHLSTAGVTNPSECSHSNLLNKEAENAAAALIRALDNPSAYTSEALERRFSWSALKPQYETCFSMLVQSRNLESL